MSCVSPLDLVLSETARMPVRHPVSGEPLTMPDGEPQWLELAGMDSLQFRRAMALPRAEGDEDAWSRELVTACTVGWRLMGPDGTELPYSQEAVAALYARLGWLREQADRWMARREHYLGNA